MNQTITKYAGILALCCLISFQSFAQQRQIDGRVVSDVDGKGIPGASVLVKGTSRGTVADIDGQFSLVANDSEALVISSIGFLSRELQVAVLQKSKLEIVLTEDISALDEVIVIGYGTQRKSDLTGSISSISSEELERTPTNNIAELLRGKAPGVQVTTGNARPGGSSVIRIRGTRSISGGNAPLFVVDGAPVEAINDLNASDIASVEVLKDASAAAIYGARASNGVILITTKRGKTGPATVSYNSFLGVQQFVRNFDLFSPLEYADMRREAFRAGTATQKNPIGNPPNDSAIFGPIATRVLESGNFVDWEDLVLRENPIIQQHDLSVRGGTEKTKVAASASFYSQDGIIPFSYYERGSVRLNLDQQVNDKLKFGVSSTLSRSTERIQENLLTVLTMTPLAEPFDGDGNQVLLATDDEIYTNPLFNLENSDNKQTVNRATISVFADYEIAKGLTYRLNTNLNFRNRIFNEYLGVEHVSGRQYGGQASLFSNENIDYLVENIINYKLDLKDIHSLNFTALQSSWEQNGESLSISTREIGNDILGWNGISNGTELRPPSRSAFRRTIVSYMGRVSYGLLDRYLFTMTGRVDGSSVFGNNNKYGFFPSAAFAWKIKEENFLKDVSAIDALKLRVSYGAIGNQGISPYQTLSNTSEYSYLFGRTQSALGYLPGPNDLPNQNLKWETTTSLNTALDFSLFKGKIDGGVDLYITNTTDLLFRRRVPGVLGFTNTFDNLGKVENKGVETHLSAYLIDQKDFSWQINANFAANRNKIISLYGELDENGRELDDVGNFLFIGLPINVNYDYVFDGIWQLGEDLANSPQPQSLPGHIKIKDLDGDGLVTPEDRIPIILDPKWYGTFATTINYKGFDIYAELNTVQGIVRRNPNLYDYDAGGTMDGRFNGLKRDYWTPENPSNTTFRPASANGSPYKSSASYQDASYVRLRTLTVGYSLPTVLISRIGLSRARIYGNATNLFTSTIYQSYGPETNPNSYPEARVLTMGLNLSF